MVAIQEVQECVTNALLNTVAGPKKGGLEFVKFRQRALSTLLRQGVLTSETERIPRKSPHGGGISQGTLRMSHNTPSRER